MPREPQALVEELEREFGIPREEGELYVAAIQSGTVSAGGRALGTLCTSLVARGMMIRSGDGEFKPVHPRLAISNAFRTHGVKEPVERKRKRLLADRLTLELVAIQERAQSKSTNVGRTRGL